MCAMFASQNLSKAETDLTKTETELADSRMWCPICAPGDWSVRQRNFAFFPSMLYCSCFVVVVSFFFRSQDISAAKRDFRWEPSVLAHERQGEERLLAALGLAGAMLPPPLKQTQEADATVSFAPPYTVGESAAGDTDMMVATAETGSAHA